MRRARGWIAAAVGLGLFAYACTPDGADGGSCKAEGGIAGVRYVCDEGLVCNEALDPKTCEQPNTHGRGEPCSQERNCKLELWCPETMKECAPRKAAGEPCPVGVECAQDLVCKKPADGGTMTCEDPG